jgi:hypothetical protein
MTAENVCHFYIDIGHHIGYIPLRISLTRDAIARAISPDLTEVAGPHYGETGVTGRQRPVTKKAPRRGLRVGRIATALVCVVAFIAISPSARAHTADPDWTPAQPKSGLSVASEGVAISNLSPKVEDYIFLSNGESFFGEQRGVRLRTAKMFATRIDHVARAKKVFGCRQKNEIIGERLGYRGQVSPRLNLVCRGISAVFDCRLNGKIWVVDIWGGIGAGPNISTQLTPSSVLRKFDGITGSVSRFLGGFRRDFGISQAFADEPQLHPEQSDLKSADQNKGQSEVSDGIIPPVFLVYMLLCGIVGFGAALLVCRITGVWQ